MTLNNSDALKCIRITKELHGRITMLHRQFSFIHFGFRIRLWWFPQKCKKRTTAHFYCNGQITCNDRASSQEFDPFLRPVRDPIKDLSAAPKLLLGVWEPDWGLPMPCGCASKHFWYLSWNSKRKIMTMKCKQPKQPRFFSTESLFRIEELTLHAASIVLHKAPDDGSQ